MSIVASMEWRYATKKFAEERLTDAEVDDLLEAVRLAPSSYGLQPYKFIVIKDPALRETLRAAAFNQPQVADASHLLVIASETDVNEQTVARFIDNAAKARSVDRTALKPREDFINNYLAPFTKDMRSEWAQKQAYLALGVFVAAAAEAKIDMCPMEGLDRPRIDEILDLSSKNLTTVAFVTLGKRSSEDPAAAFAKVRKTTEELFPTV
ncbi:NAD(P)H-dependent oxidoreductase [Rhizobium mesosinicum]|uniref:NAD(P)H-dependent oxidoreductase n=1 Tax=Rhizobium mesosinicum TaxID=335017 RepID=A0ABS7GXU4_9HYPH|nr:NAD(P)H-dependent oxidoreductase [Rhizobium mesosinicum]MBW9054632.1 NAD(P)H-dependent oxidoreductase [Rhizobium mesosinicum]